MKPFKQFLPGPDRNDSRWMRHGLAPTEPACPRPRDRSLGLGKLCVRSVFAATLATFLLGSTDSRADVTDPPTRTMPHQEDCAMPLPANFWADAAARRFQRAEEWAWNERICLGRAADMRYAPSGSGDGGECQPAKIEEKGEAVPIYRELRPEFLELILSHEPWASTGRHPQVAIRCAFVRGHIDLDDHEITPTFAFHEGKIDGEVSLVGTKFRRTLSLRSSTVTGRMNGDRLDVGGGLLLGGGGSFESIRLIRARIASDMELHGSSVTRLFNAEGLQVGGSLFLNNGSTFSDINLNHAIISGIVGLSGSTVSGTLAAVGLEVGRGLYLHEGGSFADIDLIDARIAGDAVFNASTVSGMLKADGLQVGGSLFLRDGAKFADIRLLGARIAGNAEFSRSTVTNGLNGDRLLVEGSLIVGDDGTFARISMLGARIVGDAVLRGSTVNGPLNADGLEVGGSLILGGGTFRDIDLRGTDIAGNAELNGSTVAGTFTGDRMEVGGNLNLRDGSRFSDIRLPGAGVSGNVELNGSTVAGTLSADSLDVGGALFFHDGGKFATILLRRAKIGGDVFLPGSSFAGEFDLTGAVIGAEIHLSSGLDKRSPSWHDGASLILRNVEADALQAQADSWNVSGSDRLLPTDLTGFMYDRLGGLDTSGNTSMGDESADWLVGWIETQRDHGSYYDPQPYTQLARVLEAAGATDKAKAIRYARFEHKRAHDKSLNGFDRLWLDLKKYFVGYGVYPERALYWFAALVVLGAALVQFSPTTSVRRWMGLWYSLDNALPLIQTTERFRKVEHGRPWLDHFFHLQKIFGFVLATVLVAALALLGGS
ncbi:MAG: hypothetical protein F4X98_11045 [Gammaproteobacteria bacterium]|nr:hypothetical protein [Gammaproteobacteria bacterium]